MTEYQRKKSKVIYQAIIWQEYSSTHNCSWLEVWLYTNYFTKIGKRYGLIKEFIENGII